MKRPLNIAISKESWDDSHTFQLPHNFHALLLPSLDLHQDIRVTGCPALESTHELLNFSSKTMTCRWAALRITCRNGQVSIKIKERHQVVGSMIKIQKVAYPSETILQTFKQNEYNITLSLHKAAKSRGTILTKTSLTRD